MADVVIKERWIEDTKEWPVEERNALFGALIWSGSTGEDVSDILKNNVFAQSYYKEIKNQVGIMQDKYNEQKKAGQTHGRVSTFSVEENKRILELANSGMRVKEIAAEMGITDAKKIKALYNSDGWKNRKKS